MKRARLTVRVAGPARQIDALDQAGRRTVADRVASAASVIAADLTLQHEFDVDVETEATTDGASLSLLLDGQAFSGRADPVWSTPSEAAELAVADLYLRRTSMVARPAVESLWTEWVASDWDGDPTFLPFETFGWLVQSLLSVNVSLDDGRDFARREWELGHRPADAEVILERVLTESASIGIWIHLHPANVAQLESTGSLTDFMAAIQGAEFVETGVLAPRPTIVADEALGADRVLVRVNDLRLPATRWVRPDERWVWTRPDVLLSHGIAAERYFQPFLNAELAVIAASALEQVPADLNAPILDQGQFLVDFVDALAKTAIRSFVTHDAVEITLEAIAQTQPVLAEIARERYGVTGITSILRAVVDRGIRINDLPTILGELLAISDPVNVPSLDLDFYVPHASRAAVVTNRPDRTGLTADELSFNIEQRLLRRLELLDSVDM
jgi:hypothetical protein